MSPVRLVRSNRSPILVAIVTALLAAHTAAFGADPNGFPVCTAAGDQMLPVVVPDGTGGVIIAWLDRRPTVAADGVCFAQRVNAQGVPQWAAGGVQLSTSGDVNPPVIVADGAGGAYVAFGGDASRARVQWVNASGVIQWGADGSSLTTASSAKRDLAIARDVGGAGGAIVGWREVNGLGGLSDIYAQKVNAAGAIQWAGDGTPVIATSMNSETLPALASDGGGGAFFIWLGSNGARAQRLNSAGATQWNTTPLSGASNNRVPAIAPDGAGGMVAAWAGGGTLGTFAQRVDASGNKLWNPPNTGIQLSTGGNQITMIPDGVGGGIFVWQENRVGTNFNLYAQKLNGSGALQWLATGAEVCVAPAEQFGPMIVSDGGTGAIITWYDLRSGMTAADIYAQRIDAAGASQWTTDGNPLCVVANPQEFPTIASDAAGGAFVVWEDFRSGSNEDIYASHIGPGGAVLDVPSDGGEPSISGPWPHPFTDQVQLALVLPGAMPVGLDVFDVNGRRVRSLGSRALEAGPHRFTWDGRLDDGGSAKSGIYFLRVSGPGLSLIRSVVRLR